MDLMTGCAADAVAYDDGMGWMCTAFMVSAGSFGTDKEGHGVSTIFSYLQPSKGGGIRSSHTMSMDAMFQAILCSLKRYQYRGCFV